MALAMARPYKHSITGVYWFRRVIPVELRGAVGKRELKVSLRTKDPTQAKIAAGPVGIRFDAMIANARRGQTALSAREIEALCGAWYRERALALSDDPGSAAEWEDEIDYLSDQIDGDDPDPMVPERDRVAAGVLLETHGHLAAPEAVAKLARSMFRGRWLLAQQMRRRAAGDWSEDENPKRFPTLVSPSAAATPTLSVTFASLVAAWGAERGTTGKALYDRERTAKAFETFLGHDDATRVTAEDAIRWKEARLGAGLSAKTVTNDINELQPIWKWAKVNRKLSFTDNPFAGIAPRPKRASQRPRGPFTADEARRVLVATRTQTGLLRWLPWLLCFTGARLGEVCQANKADFQRHGTDGPWFLAIHEEGEGSSLKTAHSARMVPLHPALEAEGFMDYLASLPAKSPLFPSVRPDKFGARKGTATKTHGRWVRRTVGITDNRKDPAHAWRHYFEDRGRRASLQQPVIDGLLGHKNPANESENYGRGYGSMPDITAPQVAKMSHPLDGALDQGS